MIDSSSLPSLAAAPAGTSLQQRQTAAMARLASNSAAAEQSGARRLARVAAQLQLHGYAHLAHDLAPPAVAAAAAAAAAKIADTHAYVNQIANGAHIPSIGLGCAYVGDETAGLTQTDQTTAMVTAALGCGYRHFDTAQRCEGTAHMDPTF